MNNYHKKRFFVIFMVLALFFIIAVSLVLWLVLFYKSLVVKMILWLLLAFLFSFIIIFAFGILMLVQKIYYGKDIGLFSPIIKGSMKLLYPIIMTISDVLAIDKDKIRGSFIKINNQLLLVDAKKKYQAKEILLLIPHCLQNNNCKFNVTSDIKNCMKCGKCDINEIVRMVAKYGVDLAIAPGGTLARKIIKEKKPLVVLAVACERDLSSGILDCDPMPVIGVLNLRPNGPCFNTGIDINELEENIKNFIREEN